MFFNSVKYVNFAWYFSSYSDLPFQHQSKDRTRLLHLLKCLGTMVDENVASLNKMYYAN